MIEVKNVYKKYDQFEVLKDVSLTINKGEIFGIIGHSGAGKSTILRCFNGLEGYNAGSIKINGHEIKDLNQKEMRNLRKNMGMIFQSFNLMNSRDVYGNIQFPLEIWKYDKSRWKERVHELLEIVGLEDKIHNKPSELSGGQKQRVAIARALALNPEILLCDEATSALDPKTTKDTLELLKKINQQLGITIVMVTHQMEVIKQVCSRISLMKDGKVKAYGDVQEMFLNPTLEMKEFLGEEEILPQEGVNIRIFFPSNVSQNCLITSMARELDVDFSIVWGKLEKFRQNVLGSLIINTKKEEKEKILNHLKSNNVSWEVVDDASN